MFLLDGFFFTQPRKTRSAERRSAPGIRPVREEAPLEMSPKREKNVFSLHLPSQSGLQTVLKRLKIWKKKPFIKKAVGLGWLCCNNNTNNVHVKKKK